MNVLEIMASEKQSAINRIITKQLGHWPSIDERKLFVVEHNLNEMKVSYKGELIVKMIVHAPVDAWKQEFLDS